MAVPQENLPPYPEHPYSRRETDLKLEVLEQRIDSKFDRILSEIQSVRIELTAEINGLYSRMDVFDAKIDYLKTALYAFVLPLLIALLVGVIGAILAIVGIIWPYVRIH